MFAKTLIVISAGILALSAIAQSSPSSSSTASAAAPTPTAPPVAAQEAGSTIGEITRLARELKVEQIKKELRDARKSDVGSIGPGGVPRLPAGAYDLPAPAGGAGSMPGSPQMMSPTVASLPRPEVVPPVAAIGGMGGQLRAYLQDGRELRVGSVVSTGPKLWTVRSIAPESVSFEVCENPSGRGASGRKGGGSAAACALRSLFPSVS